MQWKVYFKNTNEKMKNKIQNIIIYAVLAAFIWMSISNIIQAIKCPAMTQTELFLHIPASFMCNWEICE